MTDIDHQAILIAREVLAKQTSALGAMAINDGKWDMQIMGSTAYRAARLALEQSRSVRVVSQNDFPVAVFDTQEGADNFISKQAKKDINSRPIYWHCAEFKIHSAGDPIWDTSSS